jgi:hypothetical protein
MQPYGSTTTWATRSLPKRSTNAPTTSKHLLASLPVEAEPRAHERVKKLARNFAQDWLRPSDPDHAEPVLVDTLANTMQAFYACARWRDG